MTIKLHGFALSNYYNKVKFVLLEKGLPFEEVRVATGGKDAAVLAASPLGKIPFITTEHGALCESAVICEYLEAIAPQPALLPADPWAAAKVREISTFAELHLELVARELYAQAFFGGSVSTTSTRVPGSTKPATPITSSTRTLTARSPSGMVTARPPPAPRGASLASSSSSLAFTGVMSPRPTTRPASRTYPGGTASPCQSIIRTSACCTIVPSGRSRAATATWVRGASAAMSRGVRSRRYARAR